MSVEYKNRQIFEPPRTKETKNMAKNYIHSTASQPMTYPIYAGGTDKPVKVKDILINGRANVRDPHAIMTPTGAVTEVSDADLELLKKNPAFQRHVARGFMRVMNESELNTKDMQKRDNCAQINDEEYAMGTDPRTPGSGSCQATCGEGDRVQGRIGVNFQANLY